MEMTFLTRAIFMSGAAAIAIGGAGCGDATEAPNAGTGGAITDIPMSSVKDQEETGNCWIYSTTAWIESIAASPVSGETRDLSVAYINYWQWYDQITGVHMGGSGMATGEGDDGDGGTHDGGTYDGGTHDGGTYDGGTHDGGTHDGGTHDGGTEWSPSPTVTYGGYWGTAVDLIARFGVMRLGAFVKEEAQASIQAQKNLNRELTEGDLSDRASRRDRVKVRAVMDRAWGLSPELSAALTSAFGKDGLSTFDKSSSRHSFRSGSFAIAAPRDIRVRWVYNGSTLVAQASTSLESAIGTRTLGSDVNSREGLAAWSAAKFDFKHADAASQRAYLQRVQRALHDGVPLPISWAVAWDHARPGLGFVGALDPNKTYRSGVDMGLHATLLVDYEATNVPGYGTLRAGTIATPDQRAAALSDEAQITLLRVKNSWGTAIATIVPGEPPKPISRSPLQPGYYDLETAYLFSWTQSCDDNYYCFIQEGLNSIVLPKGY